MDKYKTIDVICQCCGKTFFIAPAEHKREGKGKYCSYSCMGKISKTNNGTKFKKTRAKNYHLQKKASYKVQKAIRDGNLTQELCEVCGKEGTAHHDDYAKPLEVRWLCHRHHLMHHLLYDNYSQLKLF